MSSLWNSYAIINPQMVKNSSTKEEKEALTNIIQLVRYAFNQIERRDAEEIVVMGLAMVLLLGDGAWIRGAFFN